MENLKIIFTTFNISFCSNTSANLLKKKEKKDEETTQKVQIGGE